jgi:hypothetical protein
MRQWILFACLILLSALGVLVPAAAQASTVVNIVPGCQLTSGESYPGTISVAGEQIPCVFYAATAPENGSAEAQAASHVTFQVSKFALTNGAAGGGSTVNLKFYKPNGTLYTPPSSTCLGYFTGNNFCAFNLPAGSNGWWRAVLEPQGRATGSLTLTFAANTANTELSSTVAAGATINVEGQWEDYTFNATEGDQVTFRASNFTFKNANGSGSQVYLVFYENNGSLYGSPPPQGCYFTALGGSCTISPPAGSSGTWFAFLEPAGPAVGSLTLTMS